LAGDCYQNAYDLAEEESRILDIPISDLLERKFGDYYRKRVAFDQYFDRGRWFRYGALNIGGVGARIYGEFCIILDGEAIGACLAFVAGDSLKPYVDASGTLDETAIIRDAVPLSHCHCLATIVVGEQIIQAIESDWPMIVCSDVNYLEAIFLGEVKRPLLSGIRISESDYQRLFDLVYPRPARKLEEAERALAHDFIQILGAIKIESLILERIAG
jgi:hypothetical protein